MNVAILGCGPAGLMAAHAATLSNNDVTILSEKRMSHINGAQYIHAAIPDLHNPDKPDGEIAYYKHGDRDVYAEKVYGDPGAPCSWDHFEVGERPAWSMGEVYTKLWLKYEDKIQQSKISPYTLDTGVMPFYDLVISSIPVWSICHNKGEHKFNHAKVSFVEGTPPGWETENLDNVIVYSGRIEDPWYRASLIFGHAWREYGGHYNSADFTGIKPVDTDCDCYPAVKRVGRFGKWEKSVLVQDAFWDTLKLMEVYA